MPHEQLVFQVGNYANFVGTHLWNGQLELAKAQDACQRYSVNTTPLYTTAGGTVVPRVLIIDKKSNFGRLGRGGWVPKSERESMDNFMEEGRSNWSGSLSVMHVDEAHTHHNEYLDAIENAAETGDELAFVQPSTHGDSSVVRVDYRLDDRVKFWSDYMAFEVAPKNLFQVSDLETNGQIDLEDRVATMLEECDLVSSTSLIIDPTSPFARSSSLLVDLLHASSKGCPSYIYTVSPPSAEYELGPLLSRLLLAKQLFDSGTLIVDLGLDANEAQRFSHLHLDPLQPYHASAVVASALADGLILPTLLNKDSRSNPHQHLALSSSMKFATLSALLPFPIPQPGFTPHGSLCDVLFEDALLHAHPQLVHIAPQTQFFYYEHALKLKSKNFNIDHIFEHDYSQPFAASAVGRGLASIPGLAVQHDSRARLSKDREAHFTLEWARAERASDLWDLYVAAPRWRAFYCDLPHYLPVTYPSITRNSLSAYGAVLPSTSHGLSDGTAADAAESARASRHVLSLPTATMTASGRWIGVIFRSAYEQLLARKREWRMWTADAPEGALWAGLEPDDLLEVCEFAARTADLYLEL